jgi:hypothetical protein
VLGMLLKITLLSAVTGTGILLLSRRRSRRQQGYFHWRQFNWPPTGSFPLFEGFPQRGGGIGIRARQSSLCRLVFICAVMMQIVNSPGGLRGDPHD